MEKNSGFIFEKQFNAILQETRLAQYQDEAKHKAIAHQFSHHIYCTRTCIFKLKKEKLHLHLRAKKPT